MKELEQYSAEDFAANKHFIRWVLENRKEDQLQWQQWINEHPHKQDEISTARAIVLSLKIDEQVIGQDQINEEITRTLGIIHQQRPRTLIATLARFKYAAIVIGIIATAALIYTVSVSPTNKDIAAVNAFKKSNGTIKVINTGSEEKLIQLADGSTVRLAPESMIQYSERMASLNTRDVYLSGEAFFQVTKNAGKPFRVFSEELVTKVLGTSFTVKANKNDGKISVIVHTGKVSVYDKSNTENVVKTGRKNLPGVVLTPNQELVYSRAAQKFEKNLVELPVLINPEAIENDFQYDDVPVTEVLAQFRRAFDISILFDAGVLKDCRITADLSDESIYRKLDLVCRALDASYEVVDGQITITAKPCT